MYVEETFPPNYSENASSNICEWDLDYLGGHTHTFLARYKLGMEIYTFSHERRV